MGRRMSAVGTAESPTPAPVAQAPRPADSFRERKTMQLQEERGAREEDERTPAPGQAPDDGYPTDEPGSTEDADHDALPMAGAEGEYDQDDPDAPDGALDDDGELPPDQDDAQEPDQEDHDWEKRYKDLQSETQRILESRGEMETEHAQLMQQTLDHRFQLEDQLSEAKKQAEFMLRAMTGNAQQFRSINWAQVPPDQVQAVQAQAQNAFQMEQQATQAYQQFKENEQTVLGQVKEREAALAKVRLRRTIPAWGNETYAEIRKFAAERGMPLDTFNEITDPVLIEALYAYKTMNTARSSVKEVKTNRKSAAPRGRAARRQPRNSRGQYQRAKVIPNKPGSFAEKTRHRLAMEDGR